MSKTITISDKLYDSISRSAQEDSLRDRDEFNPMDLSGGNFDDAFELGENEGWNELAKKIIDQQETN